MAAAIPVSVSLILSSDSQPSQRLPVILSPSNIQHPFLSLHKSFNFSSRFRVSSKCSSPSPSSSTTTSTSTTTETETSSASTTYSYLEDSYKTGRFLSNEEIEKLNALQNFRYYQQLETGSICVRLMKPEEMDITVKLLAESFVESMLLPVGYVSLLRYLVKQYLIERRAAMPHAVTLIGFYKGKQEMNTGEEKEDLEELAGTVEVCFDKRGANTSPPTPTSPKNAPYICNMAVKQSLRRRGIGWNLLKASEELISQMSSVRDVYLHCRMIDLAPLNMYTKAGYNIVKTDSIRVLLMLQRRKHLMCKKLAVLKNPSELDIPGSDTELSSQLDMLKS
uniref:N-acetyltransferase domain-containing protein n=1 Tax=Populus davidiana TaxID=266767 RepID=A0A6M2E5Q9_9ROSI